MSEWMPIETAPKDGTSILLYAESWEMTWGEIQVGAYHGGIWRIGDNETAENEPGFDPNAEVDFADWDDDVDYSRNLGPTHWQPLPHPPLHDLHESGET